MKKLFSAVTLFIAFFLLCPQIGNTETLLNQLRLSRDSNKSLIDGGVQQARAVYLKDMTAASASTVIFPNGTNFVLFSSTQDFYLQVNPSIDTDGQTVMDDIERVLSGDTLASTMFPASGEQVTTGELNPVMRFLSGATRVVMITAASDCVVTMGLYK